MRVLEFLFILAVPIGVVAGAVVSLFAIGALFYALEHPEAIRQQIEAVFRRPPAAPCAPGPDHYYKPFWASRKAGS